MIMSKAESPLQQKQGYNYDDMSQFLGIKPHNHGLEMDGSTEPLIIPRNASPGLCIHAIYQPMGDLPDQDVFAMCYIYGWGVWLGSFSWPVYWQRIFASVFLFRLLL